MNLKEVLAISGYSGLFRYVSQGRTGVIVEGIVDKKRMNTSSSTRVSALEDIAVYTDEKELPLKEIFRRIYTKENGGNCIDSKSDNAKLKKYFTEIVPNYDVDKVYTSDMKKLFSWYNILLAEKMIDLEEDPKEEEVEASESEVKA